MLLVAKLANTKRCKTPEKWLKPWLMGTHLKVFNVSYPMNTNMTWFRWLFENLCTLIYLRKVVLSMEGLMKLIVYYYNRISFAVCIKGVLKTYSTFIHNTTNFDFQLSSLFLQYYCIVCLLTAEKYKIIWYTKLNIVSYNVKRTQYKW